MIVLKNAQRTGLFDLLGRLWYLANLEKTDYEARKTALDNLAAAIVSGTTIPSGTSQAEFRYRVESLGTTSAGITQTVTRLTRDLVRRAAIADLARAMTESQAALEVIRQMKAGGYYVGTSTVGVVTANDGANTGDAQLLMASLAADGSTGPLWPPESGEVVFDQRPLASSKDAIALDSVLWPGGTGYASEMIPTADLETNALRNGALAVTSGRVSDWITRGTQWAEVLPPQDDIQFSAQPTGGSFRLAFTNRFGVKRYTRDLTYDASPTAVAGEIAALDSETRSVQVSLRSTGPGYTLDWPYGRHDLPLMEIESSLTGATANLVRTRTGTAGGYAGSAIRLIGNGSELTGLYQRFTASSDGVAFLVARAWHDGASAGVLQLGLVNGATSSAAPINRASGSPNATSFTLSGLAANQFHILVCPLAWKGTLDGYITLRLTTAMTSGKNLVISRPQLISVTGQTITRPGLVLLSNRFGPQPQDRWTWTITNDFAGQVQTWWLRAFADPTLALPRSGTTLIPESIIMA